ncbi:MAG: DsbA family protein [Pseudomonadota bacterium]
MKWFLFVFLSLALAGCNTKDQLRTTLMENPDILVDVMKRHRGKFVGVLNASEPARGMDVASLDEQFRNPKKPEIDSKRVIRGKSEAPLTIVAYSDFQCPYCSRAEKSLEEVRKKYPTQVKYLFKHFPLSFHAMAMPAAKAYEAVALQNKEKALKFQDEVFQNQRALGEEKMAFLEKTAAKVGANVSKMKKDMESAQVAGLIEKDMDEAKQMGVRGTPAFLVNGIFISGARPPKDFEDVIERWLKEGKREVTSTK